MEAVIRLFAKIAHGMMFVNFETDKITPFLPEIILNPVLPEWWGVIGAADQLAAPLLAHPIRDAARF
jgi:hypothetical protein